MKLVKKLFIFALFIIGLYSLLNFKIYGLTINSTLLIKEEVMQGDVLFKEMSINSSHYSNPAKDRTVFSYTIPHTSNKVKLATWTYSNPYGYEKKTLMDIAKDYEANHPGYIVLGGVNAEGYTASKGGYSQAELTNAFIQDGDVIRKDISYEEFKEMICLNSDKSYSIKRIPETSANPYLYIYGDDGSVLSHLEISGKNELRESGLSLLTRDYTGSLDLTGYKVIKGTAKLYRISTAYPDPRGAMNGSNMGIFIKGTLDSECVDTINNIKDGEFYIVTKNEALYNKLIIGANMKVQFDYLDEFGSTESAIGYMFKYVENGVNCDDNYQFMLEGENRLCAKYSQHDYYKSVYKERVGIGFKENGDIVLMSANTDTGGPTQYEMGAYFLQEGCNNAYQFDGGGSVTFIKRNSKGEFDMLNQPGDGVARTILSGLFVVMEVADIRINVKEIGSDYVKLDREIISDGGSDVSKLYLKIGSLSYKFNGEITINNLDSFTEYNYELLDAKNTKLNIVGSFKTLKKDISVNKLTVQIIDNGEYLYTVDYVDEDNSLYHLSVSVDGNSPKNFSGNTALIKDSYLVCLNDIKLESILKQDGKNNYNRSYNNYVLEYGINEMFDSACNSAKSFLNDMIK